MAAIPDKLYFKIGEVSKITELPTHVLRFWEAEFGQIILKIKNLLYVKKYTIQGANKHLRMDNAPPSPQPSADLLVDIRRELERLRDLVS